jgi:ABC-type glutathione transport system ATPase component
MVTEDSPVVQEQDAPLVRVEHVSKIIKNRANEITILNDLSFVIPNGSLFAVNGPSGHRGRRADREPEFTDSQPGF